MSGPLSGRVIESAIWKVSRTGFDNVLRFATFIILARYLTPAEFGVFALASLFIQISGMLASGGMGDYLVRHADPDELLKSTIFWTNLALTSCFSLVIVVFSPLIARSAGDDDIRLILCTLAVLMLLGPLTTVSGSMAYRDFKVKTLELIGAFCSMAANGASIVVALSGGGLWALVAGNVVSSFLGLALILYFFPWRAKLLYSVKEVREIFSFTSNIIAAQMLQTLVVRIQEVIASSFLGLAALGIYRIGLRFMELIGEGFIGPVSGLALVSLSKLRDDVERRANAYLRMISVTSFIYTPMLLGFAAVADDAVPLIFGEQWLDSVDITRILALLAPATVLSYYHGPTLSAAGRSDVLRNITLMQFFGTLIFTLVGVRWGLQGIAWAYVLRAYLTLPIQMYWLKNATGVRPDRAMIAALRPFAAALIMAAAVYLGLDWMRSNQFGTELRLFLACTAGAIIYPAIMFTIFASSTNAILATFRELLRNRKSLAANAT